jgi:hypothetical protein
MPEDSKSYVVERSINIDAPAEQVRGALVDFREWRNWSPWEGLDPQLQRTYTGPDSGVGATYAWKGNRKAGAGQMRITKDQPGEVALDLDFLKPFKSSSTASFALEPRDGATHVTWTMRGPKTFTTKLMGVFTSMDKLIGKDFEKGLAQLRGYVER